MNRQSRKTLNRLFTLQRKIQEIDSEDIETELQSLIANASAAIEYAIDEVKRIELKSHARGDEGGHE